VQFAEHARSTLAFSLALSPLFSLVLSSLFLSAAVSVVLLLLLLLLIDTRRKTEDYKQVAQLLKGCRTITRVIYARKLQPPRRRLTGLLDRVIVRARTVDWRPLHTRPDRAPPSSPAGNNDVMMFARM